MSSVTARTLFVKVECLGVNLLSFGAKAVRVIVAGIEDADVLKIIVSNMVSYDRVQSLVFFWRLLHVRCFDIFILTNRTFVQLCVKIMLLISSDLIQIYKMFL